MADKRTREQKLADLARNAGATMAERTAAEKMLKKSTIRNNGTTPLADRNVVFPSQSTPEWLLRREGEMKTTRRTARVAQKIINEELRNRMYSRKPLEKVKKEPDWSWVIPVIFLLAAIIYYINY